MWPADSEFLHLGAQCTCRQAKDAGCASVAAHDPVCLMNDTAASLEQRGASCGVVNARWIKPLDQRLEQWVSAYRTTVTIEDNMVSGGFGAAVMERLAGTPLAGRVHLMGIPDDFPTFGSAAAVLQSIGLDVDSIVERTALLLEG